MNSCQYFRSFFSSGVAQTTRKQRGIQLQTTRSDYEEKILNLTSEIPEQNVQFYRTKLRYGASGLPNPV